MSETNTAFTRSRDYLLSCIPLIGLAAFLYSFRPLICVAIACATALLCDLLNAAMRGTKVDFSDPSSYTFAVIFTLMLPASVPYHVVIVGTVVIVMLGKHAFGGYECSPFSPPAFGFAFVSVCWRDVVFRYPQPFSELGVAWTPNVQLFEAPASLLKYGGVPDNATIDLILGDFCGPMGATFCLIMVAILVFFIERKTVTWHVGVSFLATCAAFAFAFPRVQTSRPESIMYEMLSGALVFAAVYMASEPSISPKNSLPKVIYGVVLGLMTMVMRYYGVFEMGFCFAILLVSPLSNWFDRHFTITKRRAKTETETTEPVEPPAEEVDE